MRLPLVDIRKLIEQALEPVPALPLYHLEGKSLKLSSSITVCSEKGREPSSYCWLHISLGNAYISIYDHLHGGTSYWFIVEPCPTCNKE